MRRYIKRAICVPTVLEIRQIALISIPSVPKSLKSCTDGHSDKKRDPLERMSLQHVHYSKALQQRVIRVSEMSQNIEAAGTPDPNKVSGRHAPERGCQRQLTGVKIAAEKKMLGITAEHYSFQAIALNYLFKAVATSTAQATVQPTIGLLPMPRNPIISTCAGTDEEPANCASECIRPIVSVIC